MQPDNAQMRLGDIESDRQLTQLADWSFPIFDYFAAHPHTLLTRVAWALFKQTNLTRIFKIAPQKFLNYFHALETGYIDIPC